MSDSKPVGKPYSHVYLERAAAVEDSPRLRNRLRAYLENLPHQHLGRVADRIGEETGARVDSSSVPRHFTECSLPDLLDNITHTVNALKGVTHQSGPWPAGSWFKFVQRCLREENLAYVLDEAGGVHPAFDEEFDALRRSTIAALSGPRYSAALHSFEESIADLKQPRDTRDAVRKVFDAIENVAKLMVPQISRLGATEVEKSLKPVAISGLTGAGKEATKLMLSGMADWVNACHQYRHAPGGEEPEPPSLELAIWIVSTGAGHLRWLVGVDQARLTP